MKPLHSAIVNSIAFALSILSLSNPLYAQDSWPSKPIKIVVPVPAGASLDTLARTIGKGVSEKAGQPVVVENMAGGGSNIAFGYVAKAAPDGYTLLLGWDSLLINPALYSNPPLQNRSIRANHNGHYSSASFISWAKITR